MHTRTRRARLGGARYSCVVCNFDSPGAKTMALFSAHWLTVAGVRSRMSCRGVWRQCKQSQARRLNAQVTTITTSFILLSFLQIHFHVCQPPPGRRRNATFRHELQIQRVNRDWEREKKIKFTLSTRTYFFSCVAFQLCIRCTVGVLSTKTRSVQTNRQEKKRTFNKTNIGFSARWEQNTQQKRKKCVCSWARCVCVCVWFGEGNAVWFSCMHKYIRPRGTHSYRVDFYSGPDCSGWNINLDFFLEMSEWVKNEFNIK